MNDDTFFIVRASISIIAAILIANYIMGDWKP